MSDGVAPAGSARSEVRVVVQYVLVDVREHEFSIRVAEDGHSDQADVTVLGFRFFRLQGALLQQRHGESQARAVG